MDPDIPIRPDGLQLDESRGVQRVLWVTQRIVWAVCLAIMAVALSGFTGRGGPLALAEHRLSGATATVPRVMRRGSTDVVTVAFRGEDIRHRILLPSGFFTDFELTGATPRPVTEEATAGGTALGFAAQGPPPHAVVLHLRARRAGLFRITMMLDSTALGVSILTLP